MRLTPVLHWAVALQFLLPAGLATAQSKPKKATTPKVQKGQVLTFYGVRKLELDAKVPDEKKLEEWQKFIERATEQIQYAKKAVEHWKNAAKLRVVEGAGKADANGVLSPREKIEKWKAVARLYPKSTAARTAKKRIAHWTGEETKRLVESADQVEKDRRSKVERIDAWTRVLEWVDKKGPEARAATKRINDLQGQLYTEALNVDKISRVDKKTKLEVWRDVLRGKPSATQRKIAERRVDELESNMGNGGRAMRKKMPSKGGAKSGKK